MRKQEIAKEHKKPGRKPMTEAEKKESAARRAREKAKAAAMQPNIVVQYQGNDVNINALYEAARADFKAKRKRTLITGLDLYVKPEEGAAYYVVNGTFEGRVTF